MSEPSNRTRPRRPGKNAVMFVLSLALGAIGVFYARHYIEQQIAYYRGQLDRTEEMVKVVVPSRPLRRGEILVAGMLSMRDIPAKYADSNSVNAANYEIAVGQRVDFDVDQGRPLLWAHLEGGVSPTFSGKVPEGLRAMTVRVDEVNSISGFLQPKDRVDLLLGYGNGKDHQIVPLIQRLDVIATGVQTVVDKVGSGAKRSFSTITVQVTPDEAQRITLAQQIGNLTAVLRNPDDESPLSDEPMNFAKLFGLAEPAAAIVAQAPSRARRPRTPVPEPAGIEYIIGGGR